MSANAGLDLSRWRACGGDEGRRGGDHLARYSSPPQAQVQRQGSVVEQADTACSGVAVQLAPRPLQYRAVVCQPLVVPDLLQAAAALHNRRKIGTSHTDRPVKWPRFDARRLRMRRCCVGFPHSPARRTYPLPSTLPQTHMRSLNGSDRRCLAFLATVGNRTRGRQFFVHAFRCPLQ